MYLANGKEVWLATRGEPVFGGDGKVAELRGTVRDITDRKLVEEALRNSEQRLQLALESASLGTWSYDAETGISTGDPAMQRIFGADRASGDFHYWIEFAHPDDREAIGADFLRRPCQRCTLRDRVPHRAPDRPRSALDTLGGPRSARTGQTAADARRRRRHYRPQTRRASPSAHRKARRGRPSCLLDCTRDQQPA